jgi:hypothetical protein
MEMNTWRVWVVVLVVGGGLAGCTSRAASPEPAGAGHQALIMDAVHNGGAVGFYFLPPMVAWPQCGDRRLSANPLCAGFPDTGLSPVVQVVEVEATGDGRTFRPRPGVPPIRTIRTWTTSREPGVLPQQAVVVEGDQFHVSWDLRQDAAVLEQSRMYRVEVRLPGRVRDQGLLGYADVDIVDRKPRRLSDGELIYLTESQLLQIKFRLERGVMDSDQDGVPDDLDNCP